MLRKLSSAVDEPALHPSRRVTAGGDRGLRAARRRRHPARHADGAAEGRQRRRRDDEAADARPADDAGAAVLPLPVRSDHRLGAFPHAGREGARDHRGPARPHHRLCRADLRDRRPGGGGKIPLIPDYVVGRDGDDLLLRNYEGGRYRYPDPGGTLGLGKASANDNRPSIGGYPMRIGLTYDLRDDYLAAGYSDEETAEFDSTRRSTRSSRRARALGHEVDRDRPRAPAGAAAGRRRALGSGVQHRRGAARASAAKPRCRRCSRPTASRTPSPTRWCGAHPAQGHGQARRARLRRADRRLRRGARPWPTSRPSNCLSRCSPSRSPRAPARA